MVTWEGGDGGAQPSCAGRTIQRGGCSLGAGFWPGAVAAAGAPSSPGLTASPPPLPLPLSFSAPGATPGTVDIFFRELVHRNKKDEKGLGYLLFLQGGWVPPVLRVLQLRGHAGAAFCKDRARQSTTWTSQHVVETMQVQVHPSSLPGGLPPCGGRFTFVLRAACSCCPAAGGPGFEAARPTELSGWVKQASNYFRIILLVGAGRCSLPASCCLQDQLPRTLSAPAPSAGPGCHGAPHMLPPPRSVTLRPCLARPPHGAFPAGPARHGAVDSCHPRQPGAPRQPG